MKFHFGGYFVLLYNPRNPKFICDGPEGERGMFSLLVSLLPENLRERIGKVSTHQVFKAFKESETHKDWADEFGRKYCLIPMRGEY